MGGVEAELKIRRLETSVEAGLCAGWMSSSDPWLTLGRSREQSLAIITSPDREVYLAQAGGEPAGFVIIVMSGALVGYIQSIVVRPGMRSQGVGKAFFW